MSADARPDPASTRGRPGREARRVRLVPGGPMLIEGPVEIVLDDGTTLTSDRFLVALCMCRRSHTYPFCDTSHRRRTRPTPPDGDRRPTSGHHDSCRDGTDCGGPAGGA
ncbi:CDGSH iron-sulfur domain-containing protein [Actinomadura soli]|uniref:CDGSH iron-sulfur domain-containing protein n=1 Tax=Actinomadura soli TaxID=2508997 RepID=A0A5C4J800_9ACTN|nr:CDGSH iron-sulfur domain-containing protein [Actinomadura soli]TMQ92905.1 CDGSH iron-sulfur domain-containing protein [Actinomadura soli]